MADRSTTHRRVRRGVLAAVIAAIPLASSCAVPIPVFIYDDGVPGTTCFLQILEPLTGGNAEHSLAPHVDCFNLLNF